MREFYCPQSVGAHRGRNCADTQLLDARGGPRRTAVDSMRMLLRVCRLLRVECPADHMAYGLSVVCLLISLQQLQSIQSSDKMENLIVPCSCTVS